jgi:hypothetical protein
MSTSTVWWPAGRRTSSSIETAARPSRELDGVAAVGEAQRHPEPLACDGLAAHAVPERRAPAERTQRQPVGPAAGFAIEDGERGQTQVIEIGQGHDGHRSVGGDAPVIPALAPAPLSAGEQGA